MHRTQLFLPEELHQSLKKRAAAEHITISELVRNVLSEYVQKKHRQHTEKGITILLEMSEQHK